MLCLCRTQGSPHTHRQARVLGHDCAYDGGEWICERSTASCLELKLIGVCCRVSQNGPIHVQPNGSWVFNDFSWNNLADTIWIDQPVGELICCLKTGMERRHILSVPLFPPIGTGFSTSDTTGYGTRRVLCPVNRN